MFEFSVLNLRRELLENLKSLKFNTMTPIQEKALPAALEGKDLLAQAKTGSGKTAVFALSVLNKLDSESKKIQSLILCPTRELAEQVAGEIRTLARMIKNIKVLVVCGGVQEIHQEKSLQHGADIIVGTPGRVRSFLKREILKIDEVKTFILDEADRMLDMGFYEDMVEITSYVPSERQTMLFSATYPEEIEKFSQKILTDPTFIKVDAKHNSNVIEEIFVEVPSHKAKNDALLDILSFYRPKRLIVFCKTKAIVDSVTKYLNKTGIFATGIHGDIDQAQRTKALTMFANESLNVLVATDVAARGLDIKELPAVINLDLTQEAEVYIHRIGRTARAGHKGLAVSFFIEENQYKLDSIEKLTGKECIVKPLESFSGESEYNLLPKMHTYFISGGKKNKLRPGDIVGALVNEFDLDASKIGNINIFNVYSYVAINKDVQIDRKNIIIKKKKFRLGEA